MELTKEEASIVLNLYKQLDECKTNGDVYKIQIPLLATYALRKRLEEFIGGENDNKVCK